MRLVYAIAAIALAVGLFARVTHLDHKLFFQDEAFTALRVSGHHEAAYRAAFFDGRVHTAGEVRALETLDPSATVATVVASLAAEDPHHGPLYYIFERVAIGALGSSIAAYRALSVVFGIALIGAAWVFGRLAFRSPLGGWVLASLVAVSPFHVLYAQMAREYSMLALVTVVSSALAVAIARAATPRLLVAYAFAVAAGIYTDPLFMLVLLAQVGTLGFVLRGNRDTLVRALVAGAGGVALFAPWAINGARNHTSIENQLAWGMTPYPPLALAQKWTFNVGAVFFDAEFAHLSLAPIAIVAAGIAVASCVLVVRSRRLDEVAILGLALTVVPICAFALRDAVAGSHFATIPRYLSASWIGLEIVTAAALVRGIDARRPLAILAFGFLIAAGSASAVIDAGYENWWTNNDQVAFQDVARAVDAAPHPLIVSEAHWHVPLVLAPYLDPTVPLLLYVAPHLPRVPRLGSVFVITPDFESRREIEAQLSPARRLVDVSPEAAGPIAAFHTQLRGSGIGTPGDPMTPGNALWRVEPVADHGRDSP